MLSSIGASVAVLIAFAGMETTGANALTISQSGAEATEYLKPPMGELAQTSIAAGQDMTSDGPKSETWNEPIQCSFKNECGQPVELFWHNYQGNLVSYGVIEAGATMLMYTYATHPWSVVGHDDAGANLTVDGDQIWIPVAADTGSEVIISAEEPRSKNWNHLIKLNFDN
jgi:hypothetical protein